MLEHAFQSSRIVQWNTCSPWCRSLPGTTNVKELASFQHLREWWIFEGWVEGQLPKLLHPEESLCSNIPWIRSLWRDLSQVWQTQEWERKPNEEGKAGIAANFFFFNIIKAKCPATQNNAFNSSKGRTNGWRKYTAKGLHLSSSRHSNILVLLLSGQGTQLSGITVEFSK